MSWLHRQAGWTRESSGNCHAAGLFDSARIVWLWSNRLNGLFLEKCVQMNVFGYDAHPREAPEKKKVKCPNGFSVLQVSPPIDQENCKKEIGEFFARMGVKPEEGDFALKVRVISPVRNLVSACENG